VQLLNNIAVWFESGTAETLNKGARIAQLILVPRLPMLSIPEVILPLTHSLTCCGVLLSTGPTLILLVQFLLF